MPSGSDTCYVALPVAYPNRYFLSPVDTATTANALRKMGSKERALDGFTAIAESNASYFSWITIGY